MRWWIAAVVGVTAMPSPSEACSCGPATDEERVETYDVAFDGTVIGDAPREPLKSCALPTKVRVRPGCLEIGVFDRDTCTERTGDGYLRVGDYDGEWKPEDTRWRVEEERTDRPVIRAQICKLATGTYTLAGYGGFPIKVALDAKLGGSVMLAVSSNLWSWRTRIRVDSPIKGDLPREVFLVTTGGGGGSCGIESPNPGERRRFFAQQLDDGDLGINQCSGDHKIDDTTPKLPRVTGRLPPEPAWKDPAKPAPRQAAPAPAVPTPSKKSTGCSAGGDSSLTFALLVLLALLTRRPCRRA